ncbi:MAG: heavy metal translocating P-type ATPase [Vampirovibrionales bacterium]|nr:heavy metal translocating P-type ATPase [Vampirovibrionales bacterium]
MAIIWQNTFAEARMSEARSLRWEMLLVIASSLAIVAFFLLTLVPFSPHAFWIPPAQWPLLGVTLVGGVPLITQITLKLIRGDWGADFLAALALVSAAWLGEYLTAVLIILMLAGGQVLESYAMGKASGALKALSERMPSVAHRKQAGHLQDIALADIEVGDSIVIFPYETSPVDGTVIEGHGTMDESYLTGEPYQVAKAPGATVISGAINGDAVLVVQCDKLPSDSRYASIVTVMQQAEQKRPQLRRLGDQIGAIFSPISLFFALAAWSFSGDPMRFLAVLVVATPCPLLIAIPITVMSAISRAAKSGIIIKDPAVLERLPTCRTAIFDKTGTLTYGQPTLTDIIPAPGVSAESVLQGTASLERYSKHPLATAFLKAAEQAHLFLPEASEICEQPGKGLSGTVQGHKIQITSRKKCLLAHPEWASLLPAPTPGLECIVLSDDNYVATIRFHDAPRSDSHSFVSHLAPSHQFSKVMLVSGDREAEVRYFAELVGIQEVLASQSPEQKLAIVRSETQKAPTLFMGDGINDAPALTAATVGIAFGQPSSVTSEAAGAVILDNTLIKVDELIHLSVSMRHIALQSALGGLLLSLIAMAFAANGFITPVAGALLQELIDLAAIFNALRLIVNPHLKTDMVA